MTEFELAQLRRLPQRADETWEGGWCRLPFRARIGGRSGAQFRLALWGSLETGEINRAPDPCAVEEATPERLFTALVRFAIDKEAAGYRPGVVQVCDAAIAEAWRGPLAGVGIEVELVPGQPEDLPALAPLLSAMRRDFGRDDGEYYLATREAWVLPILGLRVPVAQMSFLGAVLAGAWLIITIIRNRSL